LARHRFLPTTPSQKVEEVNSNQAVRGEGNDFFIIVVVIKIIFERTFFMARGTE
jgi:hypothetical protein